jgi:hypothetical protein
MALEQAQPQALLLALGPWTLAVPAEQVIALRPLPRTGDLLAYGSLLVPFRPLASLLGWPSGRPRHALIVLAGSYWHGLAVDAVQTLHDAGPPTLHALPELLRRRMPANWVRGVLLLESTPTPLLNLEVIAADLLRAPSAAPTT